MSWSVLAKPTSDWADPALLTVGRATYIAQNFENNCKNLLKSLQLTKRLMNLAEAEAGDFDAAIEGIMEDFRGQGFVYLNRALTQLNKQSPDAFAVEDAAVLEAGRDARNWIAHEGARFDVYALDPDEALDCLKDLRRHVRALAAADDLVAGVKAATEHNSRDDGRPLEVGSYELLVERWVFAPIEDAS
ncbi:hypothetical protein AB0323_16635 [Arthrobacter sp. NPDC080031]|uniref:hypothetical protein n=1 Tax=Arthrobacter sp. NPDC080031 TaxID=3155918 RepID=UPI00344EE682